MKIFNAGQIRHWDEATLEEQGLTTPALMRRAGARCVQWITGHYPPPLEVLVLCGKGGNGGDGLVIAAGLLQAKYRVQVLLLADPELPGGLSAAAYDQWTELKKLAPVATKLEADIWAFSKADLKTTENKRSQSRNDSAQPDTDNTTFDYSGSLKIHSLSTFPLQEIAELPNTLIVDALFGTGLSRALTGEVAKLITAVNLLPHHRIAIDLPSGLQADKLPSLGESYGQGDDRRNEAVDLGADSETNNERDIHSTGKDESLSLSEKAKLPRPHTDVIFKADECLSFQAYKRVFMHPEAAVFAGRIHLIDIGLSADFALKEATGFYGVDTRLAASLYRPRNPFGHKGSFGTAVLVGGSYGKIGSIGLSALAALRAGAGKVFIQAPKCGYDILQGYVPEAMFEPAGDSCVAAISTVKKAVFGIGPGFDQHPESREALQQFLSTYEGKVLLDADALNLVAANPKELLPLLKQGTILTPHPKEFERLFGPVTDSMSQVDLAIESAVKHQVIIVLKGHHTATCLPNGNCYYNLSGNAGMGTAGSGDVLTGVITGLLAQEYASNEAAILGVYLHGLAGDLYVQNRAQESLIARDLVDNLAGAFRQLSAAHNSATTT